VPSDPCDLTATDQLVELHTGRLSARELLASHLDRIDAVNSEVNALVAGDEPGCRERAMVAAGAIDEARTAGRPVGRLAGLVTAHKDLTDTADFVTCYGSPVFAGHRPSTDSLLVSRVKAAGAVAIGKTNTPEFGAGSHTFNPVYGVTRNPYDLQRSAGGSSGGAAAALATSMVSVADGSDMGGSLRNPAAWNGVVGFRASAGLVPSVGPGVARATFGVEGAMGRTVADLCLLLSVIGAPDERDPLNRGVEVPVSPPRLDPERRLRIAFSPTLGGLPVEPDVADVVERFAGALSGLGWQLEEHEPDLASADECFETIRSYLFANGPLAQLGARLGDTKETIQEEYRRGMELTGRDVAAAHARLGELWRRAVEFFTDVDLLVAPVTQVSPFSIEVEYPTSVAGVPCDRYIDWMRSCSRVTALGVPALSLPAGFDRAGLPVGVQLIGTPHGDLDLLSIAAAIERELAVETRRPPILGSA
jgi:amidase